MIWRLKAKRVTQQRRTERRLARRLESAGVRRVGLTLAGQALRQPTAEQVLWTQLAFGEPQARRTFFLRAAELPPLPNLVFSVERLSSRLIDVARVQWFGSEPMHDDWSSVVPEEIVWAQVSRGAPPLVNSDLQHSLLQACSSSSEARRYCQKRPHFENLGLLLDIIEECPWLVYACYCALHRRDLLSQVRDYLVNGEAQDPFPWPFNGLN